MPTALSLTLAEIEANVGKFSTYKTTAGAGEAIPFQDKPAQSFLHGLGVANVPHPLSKLPEESLPINPGMDVTVKSFDTKVSGSLVIQADRVARLLKSAKIYVNNDIMPQGLYVTTLTGIDGSVSKDIGIHWQNLAVGVCHVQEIDLLATHVMNERGEAISAPRTGEILDDAPALLLLSSPALNFGYGMAGHLTRNQQIDFIKGMYRNLFFAALAEKREYIAMPAAGLGVFKGDPEIYFTSLMKVAKEFPELKIIFHPAQFENQFDKALQKANPDNVVKATKDVLFIADELTKSGKPCAFHNPSDSDVVYGLYDVGEYWKTGKGAGYVGEEHIGAMSTAPLNSKGLNPQAYANVVERNFRPSELFDKHLKHLNTQVKSLEERRNKAAVNSDKYRRLDAAYDKAKNVHTVLKNAGVDYFANKIDYPAFKKRADTVIEDAKPVLEKHRGGKAVLEVLINISLFLVTLARSAWNRKMTFFKLDTESVKKVNDLEDFVNKAAPKN